MCGIAGIVNLDGTLANRKDLEKISESIAHRGPDGKGSHVDGPTGLAHRRLKIIDLSGRIPAYALPGRGINTYL